MGTTVRVASMRDDGHTFHDSRVPIVVRVVEISARCHIQRELGTLTVALLYVLETHGVLIDVSSFGASELGVTCFLLRKPTQIRE